MERTGNRQSLRTPGHDYAGMGMYFITLCTENRECLFGRIIDGRMYLNDLGHIVRAEWLRSPDIRSELDLDRWIVMPNHLHGIVCLKVGRTPCAPTTSVKTSTIRCLPGRCRGVRPDALTLTPGDNPIGLQSKSLGSFIAGFKSITTKRINEIRGTPGAAVWQRNYHEHIIDNDEELQRLRQYIEDNPRRWKD
jgi:putative transposase